MVIGPDSVGVVDCSNNDSPMAAASVNKVRIFSNILYILSLKNKEARAINLYVPIATSAASIKFGACYLYSLLLKATDRSSMSWGKYFTRCSSLCAENTLYLLINKD